jgi:hypothetical protein
MFMHSIATPARFNNKNKSARFLPVDLKRTYSAHAARRKNKDDTSSHMTEIRNDDSEFEIFANVVEGSSKTISLVRMAVEIIRVTMNRR